MRVLSWNLYGGRRAPLSAFRSALEEWEWDVALLQEVPAWWELGGFRVLTSRTQLLPVVHGLLAPAGSNVILSRVPALGHAFHRLRVFPERRFVQAVSLGNGVWVGNLHAHQFGLAGKLRDHARAVTAVRRWAGDRPLVLGGDWNVLSLSLPGFAVAASHGVDHIALRGCSGEGGVLAAVSPSDHAPIYANVHSTPL